MSLERDIANAGVWHDAGGLMGLRKAARDDAAGALEEAARQFEAVFVAQVFSAMRATVPDDGPLASDEEKNWQGMLDRQMVLELTRGSGTGNGSGFGLADTIVRQLGDRGEAGAAGIEAAAPESPMVLPGRGAHADATFALDRSGRGRVAAARDGNINAEAIQVPAPRADAYRMPVAPARDAAATRDDRS